MVRMSFDRWSQCSRAAPARDAAGRRTRTRKPVEFVVGRVRHREGERVLMIQLVGDARGRRCELGGVLHDLGVAAGVVGDVAQRIRVDAAAERARIVAIDGHRIEERVGPQQLRTQHAQVDVAGGVGAVGNRSRRRRAGDAALSNSGSEASNGVVDRGAAPAAHRVERGPEHFGRRRSSASPPWAGD